MLMPFLIGTALTILGVGCGGTPAPPVREPASASTQRTPPPGHVPVHGAEQPRDEPEPRPLPEEPPAAPRVFELPDGRRVVVDGDDHVVVHDKDGRVDGESWCGANEIEFEEARRFFTSLRTAVEHRDEIAIRGLLCPEAHLADGGAGRPIGRWVRRTLVRPHLITDTEPADLFCRQGMVGWLSAGVWASSDEALGLCVWSASLF